MSLTERLFDKLGAKLAGAMETEGDRIRSELAAGLAETRNALRITAARVVTVYPGTVANAGPCRLVGWSVRETSGSAPATVTLHDGRDAAGDVLATWNVPSGSASNHSLPGPGVSATEAVYVAVTGAVAGSVYLGVVD